MNRKLLGMAVAILAVAMLASPVMAIGPKNAIGKNPLLSDFSDVSLESQNHVWHCWMESGLMALWIPATSSNEGLMNHVSFVVDSFADLAYSGQHPVELDGKWVFLTSEYSSGTFPAPMFPTEGRHGAVFWIMRLSGSSYDEALEKEMEQPYGVYTRIHSAGWS
jgi:hypothetical protein